MQKQRHTAPGGGQNLGRVGALGVLAAGALCAAVLSVASRVPPTPIDTETIPGIEIGSAPESDVTPAVRKDRRSGGDRHGKARRSGARDRGSSRRRGGNGGSHGGVRAGGSAIPVAYRDSGDGAAQNSAGGPQTGGGAPDQPGSGTGPRGGSGGDGPGALGGRGGGGQQPEPGPGGAGRRPGSDRR
jgi:hypothetical protein